MENVTTYLFTQGILGVISLVLGGVCIKLYNSREADRREWRIEIKELNTLRLQDSKDVTDKVTTVMDNTSQNIRILTEKIVAGKETK